MPCSEADARPSGPGISSYLLSVLVVVTPGMVFVWTGAVVFAVVSTTTGLASVVPEEVRETDDCCGEEERCCLCSFVSAVSGSERGVKK